jgi:hypothetical protein
MGWCLDCHRNPGKYLRPLDQVTTMGYDAGESQIALGLELAAARDIRPTTDCSGCHR